jgi:membrane-bound serine protease (ClpP class)
MRPLRLVGGLLVVLGSLLAAVAVPAAAQGDAGPDPSAPSRPTVDVVEVVGVLDDPLTDFAVGAVRRAEEADATAVVLRLDTPGALGGDVDALVDAVAGARVPVVVFVGPPGARALGAGVQVAAAADVLALAPATTYGVAAPADLADLGADDDRAAEDARALADRLADLGRAAGRDRDFLVEAAGGEAVVAVPEGEAGTPLSPDAELPDRVDPDRLRTLDEPALVRAGIADVVAPTLQEVLARLVDLEVTTADGVEELTVDPVTANVRFVNANLAVRVLHTAAEPVLAYLLLLSGALLLLFEVFQPGFGVAGVSALLVLALGGYSATVVPVSPLWLAVAAAGLLLLGLDLAIAGLSWPTALGAVLLGLGSLRMWPVDELAPPTWLLLLGTVAATVYVVGVMTSVLRAQGNQALLGAEQVAGKVGVVRSPLNPDGHIFVGGALWRARAPEDAGRLGTGTRVRVLGLNDQLTLDVAPVGDESAVGR